MNVLLVSYDLRKPGQNYTGLIAELKACHSWWHYLKSTWLVVTDESPRDLTRRLRDHIDGNDRLLVVAIEHGAARQGWLPKRAWVWIEKKIGRPDA